MCEAPLSPSLPLLVCRRHLVTSHDDSGAQVLLTMFYCLAGLLLAADGGDGKGQEGKAGTVLDDGRQASSSLAPTHGRLPISLSVSVHAESRARRCIMNQSKYRAIVCDCALEAALAHAPLG